MNNDQIVLLKCTSEYPAAYADMNIATMADMRERFAARQQPVRSLMGWTVDVAAAALAQA